MFRIYGSIDFKQYLPNGLLTQLFIWSRPLPINKMLQITSNCSNEIDRRGNPTTNGNRTKNQNPFIFQHLGIVLNWDEIAIEDINAQTMILHLERMESVCLGDNSSVSVLIGMNLG